MNELQFHLNAMADGIKEVYEESCRKALWSTIESAKKEIHEKLTYHQAFGAYKPFFNSPHSSLLRKVFQSRAFVTGVGVASSKEPLYYVGEEKATELVEAEVKHMVAMMYDGFVKKNLSKLEGVVKEESKVGFVEGSVTPGTLNGYMIFDMTDGRHFEMSFSVVHKFSNKGTYYQQFPTKFHNVVLADGTKMKTPSEAKMKKEF